jgi:hypothetical protein
VDFVASVTDERWLRVDRFRGRYRIGSGYGWLQSHDWAVGMSIELQLSHFAGCQELPGIFLRLILRLTLKSCSQP